MPVEQVEAACDGMIAKLQANLAAKIAAINTAAADGYALEDVPADRISLGVRSDFPVPWIMVLPDETTDEKDQGGEIEWSHQIRVVTWVADVDEAALPRKLLRYERAVREVLLAGRTLSVAGVYGIGHLRDQRGRVFQPEPGGEYLQYAQSAYWVKQSQLLS